MIEDLIIPSETEQFPIVFNHQLYDLSLDTFQIVKVDNDFGSYFDNFNSAEENENLYFKLANFTQYLTPSDDQS